VLVRAHAPGDAVEDDADAVNHAIRGKVERAQVREEWAGVEGGMSPLAA
jgi:hypothetical protein